MSIADKLETIAENEQKVYNSGYSAGKAAGGGGDGYYDAFWDAYQQNGERSGYAATFEGVGWTIDNFKPKYDIIVGSGETTKSMFSGSHINGDLVEICEKQGIIIDFSAATRFEYTFYASQFTRVGVIDARNATITSNAFAYARSLETIDKLIVAETTGFSSTTFYDCRSLKNITIEGIIAKSLQFGQSPLSKASIESILFALSSTTTGLTVTFSSAAVNKAFETAEGANDGAGSAYWEIWTLEKPNWTIALA